MFDTGSSQHIDLPLRIFCPQPGNHHISILLSAADDLRYIIVECKASEYADIDLPAATCDDGRNVTMERFLADPTAFVTEDLEKLQHLTDQEVGNNLKGCTKICNLMGFILDDYGEIFLVSYLISLLH